MSELENSLNSIIGEKPEPKREGRAPRGPRGPRATRGPTGPKSLNARIGKVRSTTSSPKALLTQNRGGRPPRHDAGIPRQIVGAAGDRQLLRVKNIHQDLDGQDLSRLFEAVAPVDFVKFDPRNESIAYICFQSNNARNNGIAVSKYDGRKAMGEVLVVENAVSLADRITAAARPLEQIAGRGNTDGAPRGAKAQKPAKAKKAKPVKKSVDDLDNELDAYMSGKTTQEAKAEAKLDNDMADYWKEGDKPQGTDVNME